MTMNGKGFDNKPTGAGKYIYTYPQCVMSIDLDGTMRCGRMDMYIPEPNGDIVGITTAVVFPDARVNQRCYAAQWVSANRQTPTKNRDVVRPTRVLGRVLRASHGSVAILLTNNAVNDPLFRAEGIWRGIGGANGTVLGATPGTEVFTVTNMDPSVAGSHVWVHRPNPSNLPFRVWGAEKGELPSDVVSKYPKADVDQMMALARAAKMVDFLPTGEKLVQMRMRTRYQNPICQREACTTPYVPVDDDFILCPCCKLVFYCSVACQRAEQKEHEAWARLLPDSPAPTYDPQGPIVAEADEKTGAVTAVYRKREARK